MRFNQILSHDQLHAADPIQMGPIPGGGGGDQFVWLGPGVESLEGADLNRGSQPWVDGEGPLMAG